MFGVECKVVKEGRFFGLVDWIKRYGLVLLFGR